ncbi:MAG TPA: hypothetical protein VM077_02090 [Candidatus Limnocylindrales bacterium]|nr:hypothetical protein [Candidatus Limnocylindrales bacterium]
MKSVKKAVEKPESEISFKGFVLIILAEFILPHLFKFYTKISKYFPFSEIGKDHFIHYRNRDVSEVLDMIGYKSAFSHKLFKYKYIERDQYFIYFFGKFVGKRDKSEEMVMRKLSVKFGENNVYLDKKEKGYFQIRIPNRT